MAIDKTVEPVLNEAPEEMPQEAPQEDSVFTGESEQVAGRYRIPGVDIGEYMGRADAAPVEDAEAILQSTPVGRLIDPARTETRNFGLGAIHTSEDIKGLLDGTSDIVFDSYQPGGRYRTPQTHGETRRRAQDPLNEQNYSLEELIGQPADKALNSTQMTRARMLMVQGAAELTEAAKIIHKRESVDTEELWLFRRKVANFVALQRRVQGAVREAARTLNAMQIPIGANDLSMVDFDALMENMGGKKATQKLAQLISEAGGDPKRIAKVARAGWGVRTWNALIEVWINGLLSAPTTHLLNIGGNFINSGLGVAERYGAATVGLVRRSMELSGMPVDASNRVTFTEANAMASGWVEGWKFGFRAFGNALKHGEDDVAGQQLLDPTNRKGGQLPRQPSVTGAQFGLDEGGALGKGVDFLGKWYVRLPSRFLEAEDELFKAVGYVSEMKALAVRKAESEGITDRAQFDARVQEILENPPGDLHLNAQQFARYQTFTNSLDRSTYSGRMPLGGARLQKSVLNFSRTPIGRIFLPFVRTPTNIIRYGLQRSPFGLAMPSVWADLQKAGPARDLAVARISMGSAGMGLAWFMWNNYGEDEKGNTVHRPLITGAGPKNYAQQRAWQLAGIKPYSVYVDGKYISYNRFDPFGQMLGTIATGLDLYAQTHDEGAREDIASGLVLGMAEYYMDRSFMTGMSQLIDLIDFKAQATESSLGKISRWSSRFASSFVPNWLAKTAQDVEAFTNGNSVVRDPRSNAWLPEFINRAKSRLPYFNEQVPPAIDMLGNEVPRSEPLLFMHALSPFTYSVARQDSDIAMHIIENNVRDKTPRKSVINHQFGPEEGSAQIDLYAIDQTGWFFHDYKRVLGKRRKKYLETLFQTRIYKDAPIGVARAALIDKALSDAKRELHAELFKGEVNNRRASTEVQKIRKKYRDELNRVIGSARGEVRNPVTTDRSLPPSMTYPMTQ